MVLFSQVFTAMLLLWVEMHAAAGSEAASAQTLSCPAPAGVPGTPGHNGLPGRDGRDGRDGTAGPKGEKGESGLSVQGPPGKAGPQGLAGPPGSQGSKGDPGPPGADAGVISSLQSELMSLTAKISSLEKAMSFTSRRRAGQKYYVTNSNLGSYDEALKFCSDAGGAVVLPRTEEQSQALAQLIAPLNLQAYIGATDRQTEGLFVDAEGRALTFAKWGRGQPDDYKGSQDCAIANLSEIWDDNSCEVARLIVCEV